MSKYKYLVMRTAFHGGGLVSRHTTREAAEIAARRVRNPDCTCGCAAVIEAGEYHRLPFAWEARPYEAARVA